MLDITSYGVITLEITPPKFCEDIINMKGCNHVWKIETSEGEWCGYGMDAYQYTAIWYVCKFCDATKEYEGDE